MTDTSDPIGGRKSDPGRDPSRAGLDADESNNFGPDAPNTRADDPPGGQIAPEAPPPRPPLRPIEEDQIAPDEA